MYYCEEVTTIIEEAQSSDNDTIIYLLGSHAQETATQQSDVDLLIFHQNKDDLSKILNKAMKNGVISPTHRFDIKILNHNELKQLRNKEYFLLYSMIKFGKCLHGKPIHMKFLPQLLQQEHIKLMEQLNRLEGDVEEKKDYQTLAGLIFGIGKSLRFMERVIKGECRRLKEIFGNNLTSLGKEYERITRKQRFIKTSLSLNVKISANRKTKGNFNRLNQAIQHVRSYGRDIGFLLNNYC